MSISRNRALAVVIALVVAADWITKAVVQRHLPIAAPRPVVDGWVSLNHHVNTGIAWGWLQDLPDRWRMPLLVVMTLVGIAATVSIMRQAPGDRWIRAAGALVLAGAIGNLGDRVLNGGVTDFIHVHFFPYVFNVADVAISVGGVMLALRMLMDARHPRATPTHA